METKTMKKSVYQMVTDRVMEQMKQGIIPWHRPWTGAADGAINYVTRKPYSLLNQIMLGRAGEWLTFKQLTERGGKINKGARAGMVVYYSKFAYKKEQKQEDGTIVIEEREIPVLKYYNVFHISDVTGIESKMNDVTPADSVQPIEEAENIVNGYVSREAGLRFQNNVPSNRAYYSPTTDEVVIPMLTQYAEAEEYYSTAFHELTHSTMKKSRCNREQENKIAAFGGKDYSREELVAELGSAYLCTTAKLNSDKAFKNSVAYIQGWLRALANDEKMIVWAASRAEKAARYILGEKEA